MIMTNYNTDTDVNETVFDDLKEYQEITDPKLVQELVGSPIILDHYTGEEEFDRLFNHTIDVAALCWGNVDDKGATQKLDAIESRIRRIDSISRSGGFQHLSELAKSLSAIIIAGYVSR